jgi:hypothetical protein
MVIATYLVYLTISLGCTIWVGITFARNGRVFLEDVYQGDTRVAAAVTHLLTVAFYFLNVGFVLWNLRKAPDVHDARAVIEVLATKLGTVLLVLGVLYLVLVEVFVGKRRHRRARLAAARTPGESRTAGESSGGRPVRRVG